MLFHKIKPVFVFDGATPELKRHTVASRRQQHDNAAVRLRRTAEKLFANKLLAYKMQQAQQAQQVLSECGRDRRRARHSEGDSEIGGVRDTVRETVR
jgi:DNA excision repair protein ERCC-5